MKDVQPKDYLSGQASDAWGEGFEQREIQVDGGELYVHLWQWDNWSIQTEQERFAPKIADGLPERCFSTLMTTGQLIFGGFAPNSQTAQVLSKNLGSRTVLSGSVSQGKDGSSRSMQMMERPLMTPDELKALPKGEFVVMKTGTHPMRTRLRLFLEWGITFGEPYMLPEKAARPVAYAGRQALERAILQRHPPQMKESVPASPLPSPTGGNVARRQEKAVHLGIAKDLRSLQKNDQKGANDP